MLGLRFCARAFSSCGEWGPLLIAVCGHLTVAASLVAEHRLQTRRLSSCGSRAQPLRGMWDLPRPGLEPVSPALAGRLSTTAPPGKPHIDIFEYYKSDAMSFLGYHIWRHWRPSCPSLVILILITPSRWCLVSLLYSYHLLLVTNKQSMGKMLRDHANILFLVKLTAASPPLIFTMIISKWWFPNSATPFRFTSGSGDIDML